MGFENFIPPKDHGEDDSRQFLASDEAMEQALDESFTNASPEGLDDDNANARVAQRGAQIDLPNVIEGKGPYRQYPTN